MLHRITKTIVLALSLMGGAAFAETRLVMVEQPGCYYCTQWHREIGPAFDKTAEGQFAPLMTAQLAAGAPEGMEYARRVSFTPTFILMENGSETARIEGYPGEDFFWPLFSQLLLKHTDFSQTATN